MLLLGLLAERSDLMIKEGLKGNAKLTFKTSFSNAILIVFRNLTSLLEVFIQ